MLIMYFLKLKNSNLETKAICQRISQISKNDYDEKMVENANFILRLISEAQVSLSIFFFLFLIFN